MEPGKKESPFSAKHIRTMTQPLMVDNAITVQVLGICSALAVTAKLRPSVVMGIAVIVVMIFPSVIISAMRDFIPSNVRIIAEMTVVASMVILVDQVLRAYAYDVSKELSIFVGLIITNCIVLGRLEAYALGNTKWPSFLDALGNGLGYALVIILVGFTRELLGSGKLWGFQVVPQALYDMGYVNNGLMLLAPGAFIILAIIIWIQRTVTGYREEE